MGCYVRGDKNGMGCYVRGDKNSVGCFVRGGKSLRDVLSGVQKNGMGCFVPGCYVRLPSDSGESKTSQPSISSLPLSHCAPLGAVHDFSSKTLSSNTTVSRIRHLVEKNDQKRHLVDFFNERSTTLGRKKIDQVSYFWNAFPVLHDGALTIA